MRRLTPETPEAQEFLTLPPKPGAEKPEPEILASFEFTQENSMIVFEEGRVIAVCGACITPKKQADIKNMALNFSMHRQETDVPPWLKNKGKIKVDVKTGDPDYNHIEGCIGVFRARAHAFTPGTIPGQENAYRYKSQHPDLEFVVVFDEKYKNPMEYYIKQNAWFEIALIEGDSA